MKRLAVALALLPGLALAHHPGQGREPAVAEHRERIRIGASGEQQLEARDRIALADPAVAQREQRDPCARGARSITTGWIAVEVIAQRVRITGGRRGVDVRRARRHLLGFRTARASFAIVVRETRQIDEAIRGQH